MEKSKNPTKADESVEEYSKAAVRLLARWNLKILLYIAILVGPILAYAIINVAFMR